MCAFAFVLIVHCFLFVRQIPAAENNVCPTFKDYYTIKENPNCWYDVAAEFTAPDIIKKNGYPVLEYKVPAKDGFILTVFRIPSDNVKNPKSKSYPVIIQHGIVSTCSNFIGLGKNSLAFLLADAGYDVWLPNYRGNQYSEHHANYTVYDQKFWDHSMDELAVYDMPAILKTIVTHTGQKGNIVFIGHSLGTTIALMHAAEFPKEAKETIKLYIFLSPAYTLSNMMSPIKSMAPFMNQGLRTAEDYEMVRLLSQAEPARKIVRQLCLESPKLMQFCLQMYNLFYGPNTQMGPEIVPVYFNQLPGGTALKVYDHAKDLIYGNFRKYNFGEKNIKIYGSVLPPIYDIKRIKVPIYLVYSVGDWATTKKDAWNLWRSLSKEARYGIYELKEKNFNHIDFLFGRYARDVVYEHVIEVIDKTFSA